MIFGTWYVSGSIDLLLALWLVQYYSTVPYLVRGNVPQFLVFIVPYHDYLVPGTTGSLLICKRRSYIPREQASRPYLLVSLPSIRECKKYESKSRQFINSNSNINPSIFLNQQMLLYNIKQHWTRVQINNCCDLQHCDYFASLLSYWKTEFSSLPTQNVSESKQGRKVTSSSSNFLLDK